jgi:cation:H+ antiporter
VVVDVSGGSDRRSDSVIGRLLAIFGALVPPTIWFVVHFNDLVHQPAWVAVVSGAAICGSAFLLSWATEVAQLDIPRALALAFLALVAVFPEYAVDVYFAWRAGQDASYTAYATANMTGANRLLIGVGWAAPVLAMWVRFRTKVVQLPREQSVEVNYLALATAYSFVIPIKGTLSLVDTVILGLMFAAYIRGAGATHHVEPELEGPAEMIADLGVTGRRVVVLGIFAIAGIAIFTAAEPFAEGLVATGKQFDIDEFLLVQWLAPLASESPEFIVAVLFAVRGAAAAGMSTMISSKVNQWTLLVGALPAAFALSSGGFAAMELDTRQREEIFLTSAQSLFALALIADFRFSVVDAGLLFVLFLPQFFFTWPAARLVEAGVYLGLTVGMIALVPSVRRGMRQILPRLGRR